MTENPVTITGDKHLRTALDLMRENECKHLPVVSKSHHLLGVISDRDCRHALNSPFQMREGWQDDVLLDELSVRDVMTPAPIIIEQGASSEEAARLMLEHKIGCLPVMRSETLVGIITRSDLLVAFMQIHKHYEQLMMIEPVSSVSEYQRDVS